MALVLLVMWRGRPLHPASFSLRGRGAERWAISPGQPFSPDGQEREGKEVNSTITNPSERNGWTLGAATRESKEGTEGERSWPDFQSENGLERNYITHRKIKVKTEGRYKSLGRPVVRFKPFVIWISWFSSVSFDAVMAESQETNRVSLYCNSRFASVKCSVIY